jgi:multiple sugar transport system substrate-binding protein
MASETLYDAPQSVEPEELTDAPVAVEGYEPPPSEPDSGEEGGWGFPIPIRMIVIVLAGILLIGSIIFFIFRFLSSGRSSSNATLEYWGLWESEQVMQPLIEEYQQKHANVTIVYTVQSPVEYRERLQAAIARGEGPDIFRIHNTWLPMVKSDLAAVPQDVLRADDLKNTYPPVVSYDAVSDNKWYGIPLMIDGLMLYYNPEMLASVNATVPANWEEFEKVATALTVKDGFGNIERAGAGMGTAENISHFSDILGLLFYQNGVDFTNLVSNEAETALSFYTFFAQSPTNVWDKNQDDSIVAFAGEKVAMILAPSWQAFTIQALNPNLEFNTAPVPQIKGGDPVGWATYWMEGVSAKSPRQKEAFEFLKFLSSKESLEKLYQNAVAAGRPFGPPYPRLEQIQANTDTQLLKPLYGQVPRMRSWYLSSRTYDNGINDKTVTYFRDAINAVHEGSSPRGALETAARGVVQVMGDYGLTVK